MMDSITGRIHSRELRSFEKKASTIRALYGDKSWIKDLDVVNELEGHTGCVNALSWAKSGRLLASGSDDQHINIHSYQPHDSNAQFSLSTTIATGHTANIFSVKFMPHSNDRTLISAAGDSEVRVFDVEYSGATRTASNAASLASQGRRRMRSNVYNGVRYLSDGDTNCRVYQSHGDRVKRIVTESSPHLFLTCSEDGEVRQWDLRQSSSAYPPPRGGRMTTGRHDIAVPPALISYKRYLLDLNTISCSSSQPHYIALGGAHLHCFLHDRRMLGRDMLREKGATPAMSGGMSETDEELMSQATQCVKKFAPGGQQKMRPTDNGHITACKISDANPNEMIASWSGEHIYSFDLLRTPDASELREEVKSPIIGTARNRVKEGRDRKRKRGVGSQAPLSREHSERIQSRQRTEDSTISQAEASEMALRVHYQNGQIEDIPIDEAQSTQTTASRLRESVLTNAQRDAYRLAKTTVKIRQHMFTLGDQRAVTGTDPVGHGSSFTSVLEHCAVALPDMKGLSHRWRYPVDPSPADVVLQRTLRSNRDSTLRFVQASGVIARALGGKLQTVGGTNPPVLSNFQLVHLNAHEGPDTPRHEQFCYDFIKAMMLWLDSGVGSLLEGFTKSGEAPSIAARLPVPRDAGLEAVDEVLIPYLLSLASKIPVIDVDSSRFEVDENRVLYSTEQEAVLTFAAALKVPFADLSSAVFPAIPVDHPSDTIQEPQEPTQERRTALRRWGFKVARGILMNAGEGVDFAFVDRAFGGLGQPDARTVDVEARQRQQHEDTDPNEEHAVVNAVEMLEGRIQEEPLVTMQDVRATIEEQDDDDEDEQQDDEIVARLAGRQGISERLTDEDGSDDSDAEADSDEDEDREEDEEEDHDETATGLPPRFYRSAFDRRRLRERVEEDVPCAPHVRVYRGHCNVKTVKDVNYFGLEDDYVVSGSDDGNFFIWDRKTAALVNILEGDGEVVNVVQGHPYEPMLAVSGIDHTVKIFSPDARAREAARLGKGVAAADATGFSSIAWPARVRGRRMPRQSGSATSEPAISAERPDINPDYDDEYVAPNGLASRKRMHLEYQITSQNDVERQGGNQEAFITRSMLAQLAQTIRRRRAGEAGVGEEGDEDGTGFAGLGGRIVINDDCTVM